MLFYIYMLLLPERQMGEAWERSKKQSSFGNLWESGAMVGTVISQYLQDRIAVTFRTGLISAPR
jgi:hypothetical protein